MSEASQSKNDGVLLYVLSSFPEDIGLTNLARDLDTIYESALVDYIVPRKFLWFGL